MYKILQRKQLIIESFYLFYIPGCIFFLNRQLFYQLVDHVFHLFRNLIVKTVFDQIIRIVVLFSLRQ